jgi:chorismate-pyruvate lyase
LVDLFYPNLSALGEFQESDASGIPAPFRGLLAHDAHMTVTVEAFFRDTVDVAVLQSHHTPTHYSRKILLSTRRGQQPVLFGLVRLNLGFLAPDVRAEIESERVPLGRVLIEHNVMRNVRLLSLWQIEPGTELKRLFGLADSQRCFGRTALIYCNGVPAVELLEIVTPRLPA